MKPNPFVIKECPDGKYDDNYECKPCHKNCVRGCWGPENTVGPHGCKSFEKYHSIHTRATTSTKTTKTFKNQDCPKHLLKDNSICVRICPPNKKTVNRECLPCIGPCPKICHFNEIIHAGNIEKLINCTVIEGSITILDLSFDGFQQIYDNFTWHGPRYPAMHPSRLEALSSLKEVTGFLSIQAHHPNFTSLESFRNLVRHNGAYIVPRWAIDVYRQDIGFQNRVCRKFKHEYK